MADICPHCKSADVGHGLDTIQCFSCAGHFKLDGTPTVPTSALQIGASYDGVGKELLEGDNPPVQAKDMVR